MEQIYLPMSSKKFTMKDVESSEKTWKSYVAENEIRLLQSYKNNDELHLAYDKAEKNAWIVKTLRDKKQRYLFNTCKNLIMIGSGIYPYSMFDVHRQYPHINQIIFVSVDVDHKKIIEKVLETSKAHINICAPYDKTWLKNLVRSFS